MPLVPISHRNEIKIFNDFMKDHHVLNQNNINKLAIEYKKQCDGITIFPKIPSLIKLYYKRWESNSILKLAENAMKHKVNELLEKYSRQTVKDLSAVYPKATAAMCNSDLSIMPAHDANDPHMASTHDR